MHFELDSKGLYFESAFYTNLWSNSRFSIIPGEWDSGTHRMEDLVGLGNGLDTLERRQFSCHCQESTRDFLGHPAWSTVPVPTELPENLGIKYGHGRFLPRPFVI